LFSLSLTGTSALIELARQAAFYTIVRASATIRAAAGDRIRASALGAPARFEPSRRYFRRIARIGLFVVDSLLKCSIDAMTDLRRPRDIKST
jgi:hypothetical protein